METHIAKLMDMIGCPFFSIITSKTQYLTAKIPPVLGHCKIIFSTPRDCLAPTEIHHPQTDIYHPVITISTANQYNQHITE